MRLSAKKEPHVDKEASNLQGGPHEEYGRWRSCHYHQGRSSLSPKSHMLRLKEKQQVGRYFGAITF
ncbi:unnamed protein product [Arabidopsis halleri]